MIDLRFLSPLVPALLLFCGTAAIADQHFSDEVFFDTGLSAASYHYSSGQASGLAGIALVDGKVPLTTAHFISGPNALRLAWTSASGGNWSAEIDSYRWRNRPTRGPGRRSTSGRGAMRRFPRATCRSWRWSTR